MKRIFPLLLAALLLASATACGNTTTETTPTENDSTVQQSSETETGYIAPELDMQGDELHILNFSYLWNMYIYIDHDEMTGDSLNDLVYSRNRSAEEQFNCKLVEDTVEYSGWSTGFIDLSDALINDVIAGTNTYDAAYMCVSQRMELITKNYLLDLSEIDTLQLDGNWWHNKLNDTLQIGGKQYIASGALNLMPYDGMTSVFFNKELHTNYGLDDYYTLVREGKWTLDKLIEDCQAIATPNWHMDLCRRRRWSVWYCDPPRLPGALPLWQWYPVCDGDKRQICAEYRIRPDVCSGRTDLRPV